MPYYSTRAGEYEGWTRLELIQKVLRGLGSNVATPGTDTTADYSRYPKADIINNLIDAQILFTRKTNCLTSFAIVEAVASQKEYRLPRLCLKVLDAKFYTGTSEYEQLEIIADRSMMKRISTSWNTDSAGTPGYIYPGYGYGNIRTFGAYSKPSSNGTTYSGTTMGIVTTATDFTFAGNITGTHKTGFADSAFLVDSAGRDFTSLGVTVGMMIFNNTDGSSGQITAIGDQDATNDKISVTLSGGTDNDFDVDDSFEITTGAYGVVIKASGDEEWAFSSSYGAVQDITPLSGNFLLDFVRRPLNLDHDNQYPEIPMDYQNALAEYAIWKLGRSEYNGVTMLERAEQGRESWLEAIADYNTMGAVENDPENFVEDRESLYFD